MFLSKPEEQLAQELSCPICLQLYCDPVVLPCGHNYCRACIVKTAESTENNGQVPPRCPECREEYEGLSVLQKNFKLSSIVDGYRATTTQINEEIVTEPKTESKKSTVFCDHCIDDPLPAVKTCLKCEVFLCPRHLQKHNEKVSFKDHSLVGPQIELLGTRSCSIHHLSLEYFCSNDMTTLCSTCIVGGNHQDHDVLSLSAAEDEMRRALESRSKVTPNITVNVQHKTKPLLY